MPAPIYVDLPRTRRRIARLGEYVEANLLRNGRFICPHRTECQSSALARKHIFLPGTMSHVGRRYDLRLGDKPLRIVVVGQEAAPKTHLKPHKPISLDERYRHIHDKSGLGLNYSAGGGQPGRNAHMKGTTSALRLVFGKGLGADWDDEWVYPENGRPFHIFDGFALVNRLLCFAGPEKSSQGRATRTMRNNCAEHFRETMRILDPTLLVLQGQVASAWTKTSLTDVRSRGENLTTALLNGKRVVVCEFSHPSARELKRWGANLDAPYLLGTVVPTLRSALRHLPVERA